VSESDPNIDDSSPQSVETEPLAVEARDQPTHPDPYEGAVPPGYDWPTHGGYLGCLIGLMASCLLAAFLGSTLYASLSCSSPIPGQVLTGCRPTVPGGVAALLTVLTFVAAEVGFGRLGWVLGRRFYREYAPQPTWGETDDYALEDDSKPEGGEHAITASEDVPPEQEEASAEETRADARPDELRT